MTVITTQEIRAIFGCTERTAYSKLKIAREKLGKSTNVDGKKGAEPVTKEQFYEVFGLNTILKK